MKTTAATPLGACLHALVEGLLRFVPSRHGSDGLTANERRVFQLRHAATTGFLPAPDDARYEHLRSLAERR